MKLKYNSGHFVLTECTLLDGDLARRAGFTFQGGTWATPFVSIAARVSKLADPSVRKYIDLHLEREQGERLLSAATTSLYQPPAPKGKTYRPFQRAGVEYAVKRDATLFGDEPGLGGAGETLGLLDGVMDDFRDPS